MSPAISSRAFPADLSRSARHAPYGGCHGVLIYGAVAGAKARAAEAEVGGVRLDGIRPVGRSRVAGARAPVPVVAGSRNGGPRPKDNEFEEF